MFLFGLTWLFGALTVTGFGDTRASSAFQVLFVILNAFQGFFIFLFFCVFSKDARDSWLELLSHARGHYKSKLLQTKYNSSGANNTQKKSKTSSTNLTNSSHTSTVPNKRDTSGHNLNTADHSKVEKYIDIPLTSMHAADQGEEKPSIDDDLSKEEKYVNIPHATVAERAEMEKPSIMEFSEVHETTDKNTDLGSPDMEEKEEVFERSDHSPKEVSSSQWRDDGLELKVCVKRYSTRKHHFESVEVDFLASDRLHKHLSQS